MACGSEEEVIEPEEVVETVDKTDPSQIIGYDEMKIKRYDFDNTIYLTAQEQQFVEIEKPTVDNVLLRYKQLNDEVYELFSNTELNRSIVYYRSDSRGILQEYVSRYNELITQLNDIAETHPDADSDIKERYKESIQNIITEIESVVSSLNVIIDNTTKSIEGEEHINITEMSSLSRQLQSAVDGVSGAKTAFDITAQVILDAYERERVDNIEY